MVLHINSNITSNIDDLYLCEHFCGEELEGDLPQIVDSNTEI